MVKLIVLGLVQGLTEFLPVSSSGHLLIFQKLLGVQGQGLEISIILHLGTLLAVILFFFKDILRLFKDLKAIFLIILVNLITGIIALLGKDFFESLFTSVKLVSFTLIITGIVLIATKKFSNYKKSALNLKDAVILGLAQGFAIIPGISRSGMTISSLLFRKIDKETAFKFSFLASMPAIFGAALLEAKKINFVFQFNSLNFILGFIFSFLSGLFALWVLKLILNRAKFYLFGYYCILIAIISLLFLK